MKIFVFDQKITCLKFKFILPYAVFWDDDVFSLTLEDSLYLTKVHKELGLVWREYKEK